MDAKKVIKAAETTVVVTGAIALSSFIWWPIGPIVAGYWLYKRRWRKKKNKND